MKSINGLFYTFLQYIRFCVAACANYLAIKNILVKQKQLIHSYDVNFPFILCFPQMMLQGLFCLCQMQLEVTTSMPHLLMYVCMHEYIYIYIYSYILQTDMVKSYRNNRLYVISIMVHSDVKNYTLIILSFFK